MSISLPPPSSIPASSPIPPPSAVQTPDFGAARAGGRGIPRRLLGPYGRSRVWKETVHLLLDLPVGIACFVVVVTGLSLSAGLAVLFVGVGLFLATMQFGNAVGGFERFRAKQLLSEDLTGFRPGQTDGTLWERTKVAFTDRAGWMGVLYSLIMLPWGIITFTLAVIAWTVTAAFAGFPIYAWFIDNGRGLFEITDTYELTGVGRWASVGGVILLGIISIIVLPYLIRGLANADRILIRSLLSSNEEMLTERVTQLRVSRDASVSSANAELQRIERDLHDGAQQRLVSLAMNLGMAKERLAREQLGGGGDSGSAKAFEMVVTAHDDAKLAIVELRDLVRGIHPAVLTDRGLDAAVTAISARCPIPVTVQSDLESRLPSAIEATAYFIVSEALNNVAKHSRANTAAVRLCQRNDHLIVEISDDGVGGALETGAGGLRGLRDRVIGVEGRLRIASPEGGPTTVIAELPCGS